MLIVSNFLLWVVVLLQFVAIAALSRKVKLVPAPRLGGSVLHLVHDAQGRDAEATAADNGGGTGPTMLLHVSAGCPVGQRLIADAELMARTAGMRFLLARGAGSGGEGLPPFISPPRGRTGARSSKAKAPGELPPPHVMIIGPSGEVALQGVVKSRPDLARLLARLSDERPSLALAGA